MIHADLHMHTTASDGTWEPGDLVEEAARRGLTHMAVTDHDSTAGIARAQEAAADCGVTLIPGVELSCGAQKEIHILGYGFDPMNDELLSFCRKRTEERRERAKKMVENLCADGEVISLDRVMELAGGVVARPHVARALVEAGYCASVSEAFQRYLMPGRCGYVPKTEVKVKEAAALLNGAGGVAVLAHPMQLKMGEMALEALVREWKSQGLSGVEVYHPSAANNHLIFLEHMARREQMLVTGGSDFHGLTVKPNNDIGAQLNRWKTMEEDVEILLRRIGAVV